VLNQTLQGAGQAKIGQSAAGMAYYTLFSLFPLLLLLISISSLLLKEPEITKQILRFVERTLPGSQILVIDNIVQVVEARQTIGVIGLVTLFWSASNAFTALGNNIDAAWPGTQRRSFLENRLFAFLTIGAMITLLFLYILGILVLHLFAWLQLPLVGHLGQLDNAAWERVSRILSWLLVGGLLFGIYRWVPNTYVPTPFAIASAAVSTGFLWALNRVFTLLLAFVIQNYELVYGSLSALLALMFYIYLSCVVVWAGAHLSWALTLQLNAWTA
jgi:membrane protein